MLFCPNLLFKLYTSLLSASPSSFLFEGLEEGSDEYIKNIAKLSGLASWNTPPEPYLAGIKRASAKDVVAAYKKVADKIPGDLLLRGIVALCSSPEAYHIVRSSFGRSLAVFNIVSYVLGIGDRHLDNVIVDLSDGSLIGHLLPSSSPPCPPCSPPPFPSWFLTYFLFFDRH